MNDGRGSSRLYVVVSGPATTIVVTLTRPDRSSVLAESSNMTLPELPGGVIVGGGLRPSTNITRALPPYSLEMLADLVIAVADGTAGCDASVCR